MKAFPVSNSKQIEAKTNYKTSDEIGFADLYIEVPEQDFPYIKAAAEQSIQWLNKQPLYFSTSRTYTVFALSHMRRLIHKTIRYSH